MNRPTILIIDDETALLQTIDQVLEEEGIILTSSTPEQFLRNLQAMRQNTPLLCLIDLHIKGLNGAILAYGNVLAKEVREIAPHARVQLMSGVAVHQTQQTIYVGDEEIHVDQLLHKPFTVTQLKQRIEELLKFP